MSERAVFNALLISWLVLAVMVFVSLFFVAAPYGRHLRSGWGRTIASGAGWVIMEAPAPIVFAVYFIMGKNVSIAALVFLGLWEVHYLHRAFIYPFSRRDAAGRMPLAIVSTGFLFNVMNGYLNGRYIFTFSGGYPDGWMSDPRFIGGVALFIVGFIINRQADQILRSLRPSGESCYKISNRGLYRWVSCPNYLGEITMWTGWALATWSLSGLVFAFWTVANLLPRARAHHDWYKDNFPDYPPERKALVPGVW